MFETASKTAFVLGCNQSGEPIWWLIHGEFMTGVSFLIYFKKFINIIGVNAKIVLFFFPPKFLTLVLCKASGDLCFML